MPRVRRSVELSAPVDAVWSIVGDPHHMPRWWPGVRRMEGVAEDRFTQVHTTRKGRGVRVDFWIRESRPPAPGEPGASLVFEQDVIGTPFERVLRSAVTSVEIVPGGPGCAVTVTSVQKLRGTSRLGGFMLRRATAARLDEALESLTRLV